MSTETTDRFSTQLYFRADALRPPGRTPGKNHKQVLHRHIWTFCDHFYSTILRVLEDAYLARQIVHACVAYGARALGKFGAPFGILECGSEIRELTRDILLFHWVSSCFESETREPSAIRDLQSFHQRTSGALTTSFTRALAFGCIQMHSRRGLLLNFFRRKRHRLA
jgi:hypothetical protein